MKQMLILSCLVTLCACGIDGEPTAPTKSETLSGQAEFSGLHLRQ